MSTLTLPLQQSVAPAPQAPARAPRTVGAPGRGRCSDDSGFVRGEDGVFVPRDGVRHHADEYDEGGFDALAAMQRDHFWYRGRHRFLHDGVRRALRGESSVRAIDLGGGCGGWPRWLRDNSALPFSELALGDSSLRALDLASSVVGQQVSRYQVDLMELPWENRWDAVFLLDVIEHLDDDLAALREAKRALRPGGFLFVTTPAIQAFWSFNDEFAQHRRRYDKPGVRKLAADAGLELVRASYFMFFLSPLLLLSRTRPGRLAEMSPEEVRDLVHRMHRVPSPPVNAALSAVFSAETPLGRFLPFPWGTSILSVFRKPL